jgi:short-subunit dehydrogenase
MRKAPDKVCAANNFDVAIASNKARIYDAAANLEARGANVVAMEADLSTIEGVDRLYDAAQQFGRPVDVLIANAGNGLGNAFLDQDFKKKCVMSSTPTSPEQFTRSKNRQTASRSAGLYKIGSFVRSGGIIAFILSGLALLF